MGQHELWQNDTGSLRNHASTEWRKRYCGAQSPGFFTKFDVESDPDGKQARLEIPLPSLLQRQAWNAQDPLASVHHYDIIMYVVVAATFGVRMCLRCPHCNYDGTDPNRRVQYLGCSDLLGSNIKLLGGFAGMALALIVANEYQKESTPHGMASLFWLICFNMQHYWKSHR